jgi:hypothetical protein
MACSPTLLAQPQPGRNFFGPSCPTTFPGYDGAARLTPTLGGSVPARFRFHAVPASASIHAVSVPKRAGGCPRVGFLPHPCAHTCGQRAEQCRRVPTSRVHAAPLRPYAPSIRRKQRAGASQSDSCRTSAPISAVHHAYTCSIPHPDAVHTFPNRPTSRAADPPAAAPTWARLFLVGVCPYPARFPPNAGGRLTVAFGGYSRQRILAANAPFFMIYFRSFSAHSHNT